MKLLALDTATERCSAALYIEGQVVERAASTPRAHAEFLLQLVEALLAEAGLTLPQLQAIAFGRGPGAFTGVRVAAAVTQGLAFGAGLPVVAVSDLASLAAAAARQHAAAQVLAAMDARLGEIYWCGYRVAADGECVAVMEERLDAPGKIALPAGDWFGAGSAFAVHGETLPPILGARLVGADAGLLPTAADIARLAALKFARGETCPPEQALPVYLRDRVATPKGV